MANYASQCFPARNLLRFKKNLHTDGGAWLVAYKEEQKRRFEAVLCPEKRGSDSQRNGKSRSNELLRNQANLHHSELSGMYILNELNVDDPSDIASINIIGKGLIMAKHEDFVLFDNVEHIEAGENHLTMDSFKTFPMLRDLELQLNNVTLINMDTNDFPHLEVLDLSYNSITEDDFLNLGMLPMLKRLHLTGNGLKQLPLLLSRTKITPKQLVRALEKSSRKSLFESLEVLDLDENEFSDNTVFFSLASLPRLKTLNLSKNCLHSVPHLNFEHVGLNSAPTVDLYQQQNDNLPKYSENPADEESGKLTLRCEEEPAEKTENDIDPLAFRFDGGEETLHNFHFESAAHYDELEDQPNTNIKEPDDRELSSGESLDLQRRAYYQYPFIHLQKLDISHNSVEAEDALLPLAAWPNLMEVNMWGNPLTRNCKGAPPILNHQLSKLCGIKLNRMKTTTGKRPAVGPAIAPAVRYNKVTDMPVIKRSNLLMLEFESYEAALQNGSLYGKPLPPIGSDTNDIDSLHRRDAHSAPAITNCKHTNVSKACSRQRPNSIGPDQFIFQRSGKSYSGEFEEEDKSAGDKPIEKDGVFLTQVDPQDDGSAVNEIEDENYAEPHPVTKTGGPIQPLLLEEKKYIEYKELLKIEGSMEKIETPSADDIRSNIKALQHALRHPLVFTDPSTGDSERQTYTQHQTRSVTSKNQGKDSKIQSVIENMKGRSNIIEENLDFVLERYETDPQIRKQFPEVKKLLNEVQFKYNKVRLRSLETASHAQKLLKTSTKHAKNRSTDKCVASRKLQKEPVVRQLKREKNSTNEREINAGSSTHLFNSNNDVNETMTKFKAMLDKRI